MNVRCIRKVNESLERCVRDTILDQSKHWKLSVVVTRSGPKHVWENMEIDCKVMHDMCKKGLDWDDSDDIDDDESQPKRWTWKGDSLGREVYPVQVLTGLGVAYIILIVPIVVLPLHGHNGSVIGAAVMFLLRKAVVYGVFNYVSWQWSIVHSDVVLC